MGNDVTITVLQYFHSLLITLYLLSTRSMKKNIFFFSVILSLLFLFSGCVFGAKYGPRDALTAEILLLESWDIEANGNYNHVQLYSDATFEVFDYPVVIDTGTWYFSVTSSLRLDFDSDMPDRLYQDFYFDRKGILYSHTDNNEERWIYVESNVNDV
jgi:hypothetical protein